MKTSFRPGEFWPWVRHSAAEIARFYVPELAGLLILVAVWFIFWRWL